MNTSRVRHEHRHHRRSSSAEVHGGKSDNSPTLDSACRRRREGVRVRAGQASRPNAGLRGPGRPKLEQPVLRLEDQLEAEEVPEDGPRPHDRMSRRDSISAGGAETLSPIAGTASTAVFRSRGDLSSLESALGPRFRPGAEHRQPRHQSLPEGQDSSRTTGSTSLAALHGTGTRRPLPDPCYPALSVDGVPDDGPDDRPTGQRS